MIYKSQIASGANALVRFIDRKDGVLVDRNLLDPELIQAFKFYGAISFSLAGTIVGGFFLGHFADQKFGTSPLLAILGFFIGAVGGFINIYKMVMADARKKKRKRR